MSTQYVIVQNRIEKDKDGTPKITEVLLAYPDSELNAKTRIMKWKSVLEIPNLRMRKATKEDRVPKKRRRKSKKQKEG